jgi:hypothetical protein
MNDSGIKMLNQSICGIDGKKAQFEWGAESLCVAREKPASKSVRQAVHSSMSINFINIFFCCYSCASAVAADVKHFANYHSIFFNQTAVRERAINDYQLS